MSVPGTHHEPPEAPSTSRHTEKHSTRGAVSAMIDPMFRHAFLLAASAAADAPKAAVLILLAAVDGARS